MPPPASSAPVPSSPTRLPAVHRRVEVGVALFLAFLVIEFFTTVFLEKPYPAFSGPGFMGRPGKGGQVSATTCDVSVQCGNQSEKVSCAGFVANTSRIRSSVLLDRLFPKDCDPVRRKPGIKGKIRDWVGLPRDLRRCDRAEPELVDWLHRYAKRVCNEPRGLSVTRERVTYDTQAQLQTKAPLASYHVEFTP